MTKNEVIRMAREAGFEVNFDIWAVSVDGAHITKELERFAALLAAAEREACALIAETPVSGEQDDITMQAKDRVAAAIRARQP